MNFSDFCKPFYSKDKKQSGLRGHGSQSKVAQFFLLDAFEEKDVCEISYTDDAYRKWLTGERDITGDMWNLYLDIYDEEAYTGKLRAAINESQILRMLSEYGVNTECRDVDKFCLAVAKQFIALAKGNGQAENVITSMYFEILSEEIKIPSPMMDEGEAVSFSETDKTLLKEFTDDYDDIVLKCISQNYADYFLDGIIIIQISDLYNKWKEKANKIESLSLKPYIWGMLSHLNELCDFYNGVPTVKPPLRQTRDKLRNLYVKLHPEQYANSFLYDAMLDDWISGEDY